MTATEAATEAVSSDYVAQTDVDSDVSEVSDGTTSAPAATATSTDDAGTDYVSELVASWSYIL